MTSYLILSPVGLSLFLAWHLGQSQDVKKVYFYMKDTELKGTGKDLNMLAGWEKFEVVSEWSSILLKEKRQELIIIIDDIGLGTTGNLLRRLGYRVIGGSSLADEIEDNRDAGANMVKGVMAIPETYTFESFADGIGFLKTRQKDESFYFKPNDAETPKDYTFHGKDIPRLIEAMKNFKDEWKWKESFQLQKEVKGQLMDFSVYFNSKGQMMPNSLIYYFENKPLMNDDVGPQTGGAIAVEYCHNLEGQFYEIYKKLTPKLLKDGYVGQIAINCIIEEKTKKPYFLEFCGRFGYPSLPVDLTLLEDSGKTVHGFFSALVNGETPTMFPTNKIGVTIWVGIPPYPNKEGIKDTKGVPIKWDNKWYKYFWPYFVSYDKRKGMVAAGTGTEILQITCADVTLDGAIQMLMETYLPTLRLKNAMYRTDLGVDARKRMKVLKEWGVI